MSGRMLAVQNFLVPANGKVGIYIFRETLVAGVPVVIDFRTINIDGQEFWPYGMYVNNQAGSQVCAVTLNEIGLSFTTGQGDSNNGMFPGYEDMTVTITGEGVVGIVFCNFPVFSVFG